MEPENTRIWTVISLMDLQNDWMTIQMATSGHAKDPPDCVRKRWEAEAFPFFAHVFLMYGAKSGFTLLLPAWFVSRHLGAVTSIPGKNWSHFRAAAAYHKRFIDILFTKTAEYLLFEKKEETHGC